MFLYMHKEICAAQAYSNMADDNIIMPIMPHGIMPNVPALRSFMQRLTLLENRCERLEDRLQRMRTYDPFLNEFNDREGGGVEWLLGQKPKVAEESFLTARVAFATGDRIRCVAPPHVALRIELLDGCYSCPSPRLLSPRGTDVRELLDVADDLLTSRVPVHDVIELSSWFSGLTGKSKDEECIAALVDLVASMPSTSHPGALSGIVWGDLLAAAHSYDIPQFEGFVYPSPSNGSDDAIVMRWVGPRDQVSS